MPAGCTANCSLNANKETRRYAQLFKASTTQRGHWTGGRAATGFCSTTSRGSRARSVVAARSLASLKIADALAWCLVEATMADTKRRALVGNWMWEYDGDDPYPARMYYVFDEDLPVEHGPPKPRWCRMPHC